MSKGKIILTDFERLSLVNQFLIMKGQGAKAIENNSYYSLEMVDAAIEVFSRGHEVLYSDIFDSISEPIPNEVGEEVYDILGLYSDALISFEKLPLENQTKELKSLITFDGFDGNEEIEHYSTLKVIVEKFEEFNYLFEERKQFNSHMNRLSKYRRQLLAAKEFEALYSLSADNLRKIFG